LSSDDMVRYANNLHTLWECSEKIVGPFQGPFLGREVLVKHHANMSLKYNEYYAPLEWIQDDRLRFVVSTPKKHNCEINTSFFVSKKLFTTLGIVPISLTLSSFVEWKLHSIVLSFNGSRNLALILIIPKLHFQARDFT
jgi:hypothetical protein